MVVYYNLKAAVLQVLQGHSRREHDLLLHFHSVYRFEALFANVAVGWEKGSVENWVLCRHLTTDLFTYSLYLTSQGRRIVQRVDVFCTVFGYTLSNSIVRWLRDEATRKE